MMETGDRLLILHTADDDNVDVGNHGNVMLQAARRRVNC